MSLDLTNRVAVVIGGTSGIGRAIALGLAEQGADVVPTGRRENHAEEVCTAVESLGRRTIRVVTDIRDRESIDHLRDKTLHAFNRIDIRVNAAGFTFKQPTIKICEERVVGDFRYQPRQWSAARLPVFLRAALSERPRPYH